MKLQNVPEEIKGILKKYKRKKIIIVITLVAVIILVTTAVFLYFKLAREGQRRDAPFGNIQGGGNQFVVTEDMVAASGVTSVGVTEESFDVENMVTSLEIEELYISSEDVITEGTKVLKLSEESIAEAREELEQTLKEADLAYRAGAIEYEQSKITAEYDRDSTLLSGEQAEAVYNETMSSLKESVKKAQEELTQAKEDIAEYQSYVNDDSYKSYFKVDEYQTIYDETLEALMNKMDEWGVSWAQVTGQGGGNATTNVSGGSVSGGDATQNTGPSGDQTQVLASLYDVLEGQRKDLDQAQSDYENALTNASFELQTLELKLPELENTLAEAEKNYQNQILQAELTYETSLANAQSAESDYETAMQQAENNYNSLKKDWEDATDNLELFESSVGDGYFYASGNGTILRTTGALDQTSGKDVLKLFQELHEMGNTIVMITHDLGVARSAKRIVRIVDGKLIE